MNTKSLFTLFLIVLLVAAPAVLMAGGQKEGAAKTGTVKFWHGYPEYDVVWNDMAAKDYMVDNPGVKVEISSFPLREFERKLAVSLPGGSGPDLYFFNLNYNIKYIEAGLVGEPPQQVVDFVASNFKDQWAERATYRDKVWAVPFTGAVKAGFYNTDMYAAAGLDHGPRNWDEVYEFAQKTTKRDASGNVTRSGVSLRLSGGGSGVAEKFWMWMLPTGATIAEEGSEFGKYHAGYDNEGGRMTLKLYIDMLYKHNCDSFKIKHDAEALALEQTAYFQRESWVIGYMKEHAPDVNYNTCRLPIVERDAGMMATTNLNVSGKSKVQDLAWDFALYTQRDEYLQAVIDKVGWFPAKTMDYTDVLKEEPRFDPFVNIPNSFQGFSYPHTTTADEIYTKMANKLTPAFQNKNLVDNPDGIAKVISDAAAETNEILKEAGEFGM